VSTAQEPPPAPEPVAGEAAAAPDTVAPAPVCPRCGAELRPDQEWCLNCGAATATRVAAPAGWRAPLAIVGAVLALALAGLVVAFFAVSDDSDQLAEVAQTATQPAAVPTVTPVPEATAVPPAGEPAAPGEAGADPGATVPEATDGEPPSVTVTPDPADDDPADDPGDAGATDAGAVGSWPAGETAFTVVLLSSPTKANADKRATALASSGADVGVLKSDDFKSLRGGYYVVFSGQYDSRDEAQRAAESLVADAPGAYVRRVVPR
jgi:septal ring-binding cell division protein DamX